MINPWEQIDLNTYELHMSSNSVLQLQMLNNITKQQLSDYIHNNVVILGIAGGNGLENIDINTTKKVYGIDINSSYLDCCKDRYPKLAGILELICCDLSNTNTILPSSDILICNLIIEYLEADNFVELIKNNSSNVNMVSCVIQKNNNNNFVSSSNLTSALEPILSIHNDIREDHLKDEFLRVGFICKREMEYPLPNGKEFIRIDFINNSGDSKQIV